MKKIILFIACIASITAVRSQIRSVDLYFTLMSPIQYDFVQTGKPMDITVKLKNQGPNVMDMTDTIICTLLYDGDSVINAGKPMQKFYKGFLAVNDEVTFDFYLGLNRTYNTGGVHTYCVDVKLQNRSTTVGSSDPVLSSNRSCHDVYITTFNNGVAEPQAVAGNVNSITAAPVPCSNTLTLTYSVMESGSAGLIITDVLGKEVMHTDPAFLTRGTHTKQLDVSALPAGVYFANLNVNGKVSAIKFMKQ